jgi:hypothetical protein
LLFGAWRIGDVVIPDTGQSDFKLAYPLAARHQGQQAFLHGGHPVVHFQPACAAAFLLSFASSLILFGVSQTDNWVWPIFILFKILLIMPDR